MSSIDFTCNKVINLSAQCRGEILGRLLENGPLRLHDAVLGGQLAAQIRNLAIFLVQLSLQLDLGGKNTTIALRKRITGKCEWSSHLFVRERLIGDRRADELLLERAERLLLIGQTRRQTATTSVKRQTILRSWSHVTHSDTQINAKLITCWAFFRSS